MANLPSVLLKMPCYKISRSCDFKPSFLKELIRYVPMHSEVVPPTPHLTNGLCVLIVDIFWTAISIKEFSKEAIPLQWILIESEWLLWYCSKLYKYIVRLKKQMQWKLPPARAHQQEIFFLAPFLEVTVPAMTYRVTYRQAGQLWTIFKDFSLCYTSSIIYSKRFLFRMYNNGSPCHQFISKSCHCAPHSV